MGEPTAMYGMDAYWAMQANDAMRDFLEYLDRMEPEIRTRVEAKLRSRYSASSQLGNLLSQRQAQQASLARNLAPGAEILGAAIPGIFG